MIFFSGFPEMKGIKFTDQKGKRGDILDKVKWDFEENFPPITASDGYIYKATSLENVEKLQNIRYKIDLLCQKLELIYEGNVLPPEIELFLNLHGEYFRDLQDLTKMLPEPFINRIKGGITTSRYLLSEIPKGTIYNGLNKPRMRYIDFSEIPIGRDGQGRALYRDIFLNLDLKGKYLDDLITHELAHSMANHIKYREAENHQADFKRAEELIKSLWNK